MEVKILNAKEVLIKEVSTHGGGAKILVPKTWLGKKVQVVLLEDE